MGDGRFGRGGGPGAIEFLERAVDMVIDAILTGHYRPPDSGWYSTLRPNFTDSLRMRNHMDQAAFAARSASWWR